MSPSERLKSSFPLFLAYVWTRVLSLPQPTRVQRDIADFLANGPRRRFIAAFRGVGKTFLTAAYVVWRLWRQPDLKIMIVSANERFAAKVASFVHTLINAEDIVTYEAVPWAELIAKPGQKNSTLEFEVGPARPSKDPSVFAVGITGQMTGGRGDLIIADDVEVPSNSETEAQREKLLGRTGEFGGAIGKPGVEVIYLGTFQSMASIYRGLKAKGYAMRLWPARYPKLDKLHLYEDLAPMLRADLDADPALAASHSTDLGGQPTDPARFHELDLQEREADWGKAGFQLQFMLDTSLADSERFPLKTRDLMVMDVPTDVAPSRVVWGSSPELAYKDLDNVGFDGDRLYRPVFLDGGFLPYTGSLMEIDPSGTGSDETAYIVMKFLHGTIYVRRWGGFRDGHSDETLAALAAIAKAEAVNLVRVEDNFGDGMFRRLLEPHLRRIDYSVPLEGHKVSGSKERRILSVVRPALQAHRVVLDTALVRQDLEDARRGSQTTGVSSMETSGLYQLTHLTDARGALRKDDRIDVFANGLAYWAEQMNADAAEAQRRIEEKANRDFEKKVFGTQPFGWARRKPQGRGRGRSR